MFRFVPLRLAALAALALAAATAAAAEPLPFGAVGPELRAALDSVPPSRFESVLRQRENQPGRPGVRGEASLLLGQLLYVRGEYGAAADAFARAVARLDPAHRDEARYWSGLCALAVRSPSAARAAFESISPGSPRHGDARFALALAWEMADRPERALATVEELLAEDPAAATPAALERMAAWADGLHRPEVARRARTSLVERFPRSVEAAAAISEAASEPSRDAAAGGYAVEAGRFRDESRAKALAARAARSGYPDARVVSHGEGAMRVFSVVLGTFSARGEAERAREVAARALGVSARMVSPR